MPGTRIYIGGLSYDTTERDLQRFLKGYGRMREVLLKRGFAFVEFEDHRDADDAVHELDGKKLLGERITVERARGIPKGRDRYSYSSGRQRNFSHESRGPPTRTSYRIFVENLSTRVSWQDLKDYMGQAGEVAFADAHKKRPNEGIVEFTTYADMKTALSKLDDTEIGGKRIRLTQDRNSGRGRFGSHRSRSRSGSRSARKSRSQSRSKSRSRGRPSSPSPNGRDVDRSKSRSTSRKGSVDRSRSKSKEPSRRYTKSRSRSASRSRSKSRLDSGHKRSRSRDASRSPSRTSSVSGSKKVKKSRSRSASA